MSAASSHSDAYRPWLHRWAVLTFVAVVALVALGALVTSRRAGMADDAPLRTPWHLFTVLQEATQQERPVEYIFQRGNYFIEHAHRQLGWIVGVLTIVLAAWLWFVDERSWVRWLGVVALLAVSLQGVLGILRVAEHATWGLEWAMVHGVSAQGVVCLLAALALVTSRAWLQDSSVEMTEANRFQRFCLATFGLLVIQLVVGVWLRQMGGAEEATLIVHIVIAVAVLAHFIILAARVFRQERSSNDGLLRRPVLLLLALFALQALVGYWAWWEGAGGGAMDYRRVAITPLGTRLATAHVAIGSLLLATTLVLTLRSFRHLTAAPKPALVPLRTAEGAA